MEKLQKKKNPFRFRRLAKTDQIEKIQRNNLWIDSMRNALKRRKSKRRNTKLNGKLVCYKEIVKINWCHQEDTRNYKQCRPCTRVYILFSCFRVDLETLDIETNKTNEVKDDRFLGFSLRSYMGRTSRL